MTEAALPLHEALHVLDMASTLTGRLEMTTEEWDSIPAAQKAVSEEYMRLRALGELDDPADAGHSG